MNQLTHWWIWDEDEYDQINMCNRSTDGGGYPIQGDKRFAIPITCKECRAMYPLYVLEHLDI